MAASLQIPRIVIAATGSGVGKTTVTVGLMAALRARGLSVAPFKCGPDYLDPSYHLRAAGRVSHNLDGWMMGRDAVVATFARTAQSAHIAVIEGMMGLFDAATPISEEGSSAEIAKWLAAPVLLVVDASGMARTIAAIATGFARFDPSLRLGGVICNRVGSRGHLDLLRLASPEVPVLGGLPENPEAGFPERHLGLFNADEKTVPGARFESWERLASEWFDLDMIIAIARSAPVLGEVTDAALNRQPGSSAPRCRIGVAWDEAFHFYYDYNLARLEALGAEIVRFSPMYDHALPPVDGLYLGGGYPENVAEELSSNRSMIAAVHEFTVRGGPIYAECGGLMYLARSIRTRDGTSFPMVGVIPSKIIMHDRLQALGYVEVETRAASILGPAAVRWRGHQFRYSTLDPPPPAEVERIFSVTPRWGGAPFAEGYRVRNVVASYVHAHWASNPGVGESFVRACIDWRSNPLA